MKQEHWLVAIIGLVIFAFIIDIIVPSITVNLITPYHYFIPENFITLPLTSTGIVIRALAIFIAPILFLSFTEWSGQIKGVILFVVSGLLQLYAIQDIVSGANVVPLGWSLSFALAGLALIIPALLYIMLGLIGKTNKVITEPEPATGIDDDDEDYIVKDKPEHSEKPEPKEHHKEK